MLSVFDTLKETLFLWVRNFWYLVPVVLILGMPSYVLLQINSPPKTPHPSGIVAFYGIFVIFVWLLLDGAKAAAILAVLRMRAGEKANLVAICSSIKKYTWTLVRLMVLIGLTFIPFGALISLIVGVIGKFVANKFVTVFVIGFFLVLIKYALAYPLVVVENLAAWQALKQSWKMTKGHFFYVFGCYLVLWSIQWIFTRAIESPVNGVDYKLSLPWLSVQFGELLVDTMWIILSWCMYLRIKEAEVTAPPFAPIE